jgi:predicted permease
MRRLWFRLRAMVRRMLDGGASDEELGEEIRAFLEHDIESKIRSGMTPKDARRAALIELGGAERIKDGVREAAAGARWESIFRDIRYALRSLGKARAFSTSVIGSLSLGLAATIMAFALINGMLVPRPLPGVRDQDRLVTLGILENFLGRSFLRRTAWTDYPDVVRALDGMTSLEGAASFTEADVAVTLPQPVSLPAAFVSPDYFDVLGVRPEIGRSFAPEESGAESAVAVIGHALWTRELGGDPSVVGRPIQVGRQTFEIIGVAPRGFAGTTFGMTENSRGTLERTDVELWLPIVFADLLAVNSRAGTGGFLYGEVGEHQIRYVGRMRDGIRVDRVETDLGVVAGGIVASAAGPADPAEPVRVEVAGLGECDICNVAPAAMSLTVPFLVLAIGCVNAANLLLVRAARRRREVAVRLALGASRLRLVRQLVIESLILAMGAALVALPLAWWGLQWLAASIVFPMALDATVVAGALVTAFLTALAFGLVPALQATHQRPSAALGTAHAGSGGTRSQSRGRRALVAGQVALSLGLLGAAFQLTSALETAAEPAATDPDRVLLASFDLAQLRFSPAESDAFYAALLDGASRLPGVEAAALSNRNLGQGWAQVPPVAGVSDEPDAPFADVRLSLSGSAEGDYLKVVGLDLVRGREFVAPDRRDRSEVAIVTERLAAQIFDDDVDALGRSVYVTAPVAGVPAKIVLRVVGVVESPVTPSGEEVAAIFFPSPLEQGTALTLHVRSEGPAAPLAPAVRDLVARLDPNVPILELATLDQKIRADNLGGRTLASVVALLGIVAVLLASMGLYGVTSYSVAIRTQELAVRMALGAEPGRVQAMVLRQALSVALIGSVLGGLAAIAIGVLIRAEVVDVAGVDVAALGGSAALLAAAMLLASFVPARRAARLAPYSVLREE